MPLVPFQIGRFQCIHELAVGSTASVYIARFHGVEGFQKLVAIKRIHEHVAMDPEFVRRFVLEARLGAALSHAGIVRVLECAEEGSTYFMVSELVDGISVRQLLTSLDRRGRRLPPATAAALVALVADALDFAHRFTALTGGDAGVVHGGLRPSKILLPRDGGAKLIDFGVAESFAYARRSASSVDWGDHAYLAPEMVTEGLLSPAADLFALGAILYELITCEPLFLRSDPGSTLQAVQAPWVPPHPALPEPLRDIVWWAVADDLHTRVSSAADLHDGLVDWLAKQRLTPAAAWALADLREVHGDWAIRLPGALSQDQGGPEAERLAHRQAVTVVRSMHPRGQADQWDDEATPTEDPWDPLFALKDSLGGGKSHVTGLSAALDMPEDSTSPEGSPSDFAEGDDVATLERRYDGQARSPGADEASLSQETRIAQAEAYLAVDDVEGAIAELTTVLTAQWGSGKAHRLIAQCFVRLGDRAAALEHCDYAASFGEEVGALRQQILGQA